MLSIAQVMGNTVGGEWLSADKLAGEAAAMEIFWIKRKTVEFH